MGVPFLDRPIDDMLLADWGRGRNDRQRWLLRLTHTHGHHVIFFFLPRPAMSVAEYCLVGSCQLVKQISRCFVIFSNPRTVGRHEVKDPHRGLE